MKENVGLVHQMPYTCDGVGLPSTLEKVTVCHEKCLKGKVHKNCGFGTNSRS